MVNTVYESARVCTFPVTVSPLFFSFLWESEWRHRVVAGGYRGEMETLIVWNIKEKLDVQIELHCLSVCLFSLAVWNRWTNATSTGAMICNQENEKGNEIGDLDSSFQADPIALAGEEQRLKANLLAIVIDKSLSSRLIFPCEWKRSNDASTDRRDIALKLRHPILIEHSPGTSLQLEKFILTHAFANNPSFSWVHTFKSNEVTRLFKVDPLYNVIVRYEPMESFSIETHVLIRNNNSWHIQTTQQKESGFLPS